MLIKGFNKNLVRFDGLSMSADDAVLPVEKDTEGIPVAWRLLKIGINELTRFGQKVEVMVTTENLDTIINYHNEKGMKIPVDSNHFLRRFADANGRDELAVLALVPAGKLAMAFGNLQKRDDGLWLVDVEFVPLAKEIMKQKAFRYYSPVIRGLADGRLRVTSVALENEPSINNQDVLAASADQRDDPDTFKTQKEKKHMDPKLCVALGVLLGMDTLSLSADGDAPEGVVSKIQSLNKEVTGLRGFAGSLKDSLSLSADDDLNKVQGHILALKAKADTADGLKKENDTLSLAAENTKREGLIADGLKGGKLSDSMLDWAKGLDCASLSSYLENAPQVVPLDKVNKDDLPDTDTLSLSADEKAACVAAGISEDDYKKNRVV